MAAGFGLPATGVAALRVAIPMAAIMSSLARAARARSRVRPRVIRPSELANMLRLTDCVRNSPSLSRSSGT